MELPKADLMTSKRSIWIAVNVDRALKGAEEFQAPSFFNLTYKLIGNRY